MILYGAGGHAKVIQSCLEACGVTLSGLFDDDPSVRSFGEMKVLGTYNRDLLRNEDIIISVGDNRIRKKLAEKVEHGFGIVVHPSSITDKTVIIGKGSFLFHNAVIQRDVTIGRHVIINTSASVDHDCSLKDFVHIAPNATLCGVVEIGEGSIIGAGSVVHPGIKIGKWCTIGAGAAVFRDVPDNSVVIGNPGKILKKNRK